MNRFVILLLMVGWAFYIVQVNSGQTGDAVRSEKNPAASQQITPRHQAAASSELQPTARAAVHSPYAIAPDEAPPKRVVSLGASSPDPSTLPVTAGPDAEKELRSAFNALSNLNGVALTTTSEDQPLSLGELK